MVDNEKESAISREKVEILKETLLQRYAGSGKELPRDKEALKNELLIMCLNDGLKQSKKRSVKS